MVFLAVFQGDQLHAKVRKICEGLAISFMYGTFLSWSRVILTFFLILLLIFYLNVFFGFTNNN